MITILTTILVIGILIIVHELGHFLSAKVMGVKVETFSLGLGPKILSKTIGETDYRFSLVPLGGYVKLAGEHFVEERPPERWEFFGKPPWRRAIILLTGPLMNFFLAWVIFCSVLYFGMPVYKAFIGEVKPGEPAAKAGLMPGDKVFSIDGQTIKDWEELANIVYKSPGKPLSFIIERKGETLRFEITPRREEGLTLLKEKIERGLIGIYPLEGQIYYRRESFLKAILKSSQQTLAFTRMLYLSLWKMAIGEISWREVGGIVRITEETGRQVKQGFLPLMLFLAIVSINLAVINLLPIPILDGGHLIFLLIEKIKGQPLSLKVQGIAQSIGLSIIIAILLLAAYNDIIHLKENNKKKLEIKNSGYPEVRPSER